MFNVTKFKLAVFCFSFASASCVGFNATAQSSGNQSFNVIVPSSISITAPTGVTITHNETDAPQLFPEQTWVVRGNSRNGVAVAFKTITPFTHTQDNNFKRDARLQVAVGATQGPATWNVGVASDTTNYLNSDNVAEVSVNSNGIGRANLNLTVSFVGGEFGVFAAGTYATTVTG
ncbi:MAG: hypothetical protein KGQ60_16420, partial [Planctomycetes bacterium]|nr:hypothetical protein [Planctomycetota bacterium]